MTLRKLHRINAILLGIFIFAHLANHMTIVLGVETHFATMKVLRPFYRPLLIEIFFLTLFGCQIILGVLMMWKRGRPKTNWAWAQYVSGTMMALFLLQHIPAAIITRLVKPDVDTNIYWAASTVSHEPFVWYFAPYYALGIVSFFVHLAAILQMRAQYRSYATLTIGTGIIATIAIVASMMGWFSGPIDFPPEYVQYIEDYWKSF